MAIKQIGLSTLALQYISLFLDLLIISCGTQSQVVIELFKEEAFTKVINEDLIRKDILLVLKNELKIGEN